MSVSLFHAQLFFVSASNHQVLMDSKVFLGVQLQQRKGLHQCNEDSFVSSDCLVFFPEQC